MYIFESEVCVVKKPKHRGRYEVYVFEKSIQDILSKESLYFIGEDLKSRITLTKKTMIKNEGYALLLASILDRCAKLIQSQYMSLPEIQKWLDKRQEHLLSLAKEAKQSGDDDVFERFSTMLS